MSTPTLTRPTFHVWLAPEGTDQSEDLPADQLTHHRVMVSSGDQLRAELEAGQRKLPKGGRDTPMHLTVLWLWASMVRTGRFSGGSREFQALCVSYDPERDEAGELAEAEPVDPTGPSSS